MERPKQQALTFLLGALLVGAVLGFSADRVFRRDDSGPAARRAEFYDDINLTDAQRPAMDALLDRRNCSMDSVVRMIQPTIDSIKAASRAQMDRILTDAQHARVDARRKEEAARREAAHKQRLSTCGK
jgi:hypothetical protein